MIRDWLAQVRIGGRCGAERERGVGDRPPFFASVVHVAMRLCVLPALVLPAVSEQVQIAPLALWPLGFLYGAAVVPAPGGGGAVELAFRAALGSVIPAHAFAAALLWWRFYTFYIYIVLGAIVAGAHRLRAVRKTEDGGGARGGSA